MAGYSVSGYGVAGYSMAGYSMEGYGIEAYSAAGQGIVWQGVVWQGVVYGWHVVWGIGQATGQAIIAVHTGAAAKLRRVLTLGSWLC